MVRFGCIHTLVTLGLSLVMSCSAELSVETQAVDVECSALDSNPDLKAQCLARESAASNLQLTITTEPFTSNSTDVSISWSEYPGATNYRLAFTEDENCLKQVLAFDQLLITKAASVSKDGTYHICVFAEVPEGSEIAANNNGVPFTIDTTKPVLDSTTTAMPAKITTPISFEAKVTDDTGVTYKWVHKSGNGTLTFSPADSGKTTIAYTQGAGGTQEVDLIITDAAGNITTKTYTFETDPVVTTPTVTPSSDTTAPTVTLSATQSDHTNATTINMTSLLKVAVIFLVAAFVGLD